MKSPILIGFVLASCLLASGCTALWQAMTGNPARTGTSSSLVDYLYPKGDAPKVDTTVPHLALPVRVGIAFVPPSQRSAADLSEAMQTQLLQKTRAAFVERDFIASIDVIPQSYLQSSRGFAGIDQLARLYGIDVIALVSFDQVAVADDTKASLLYWTIVGAYFIKGSRGDVQTFVDTAVFDVKTHRLLFRAPGTNTLTKSSTLVDSPAELRAQRAESFEKAMADMTANLVKELDAFKVRVQQEHVVTVSQRDNAGGGAADAVVALLALTLMWSARRRAAVGARASIGTSTTAGRLRSGGPNRSRSSVP